ncbi:MAG: hypothetical protein RKO24_17380 [Candidatus Competibacter sp.]|nr:hypothetical protein [Candidatus Competibacter sp.]
MASAPPYQTLSEAELQAPRSAPKSLACPWWKSPSSAWPWLIALVLFALPVTTYWDTTFHRFGLRDDYPNLREAREEPGKIVEFTASHARPLYGLLLQHSFERIDSIQGLEWLRLTGTVGLGLVAATLFGLLRRLGWDLAGAAFTGAMVSLAPSAQVIASWATGWPYAVAALLSLGGFALADLVGERWKKGGRTGAVLLVAASALIYQPSSLFYLVGIAAALPRQRGWSLEYNLRWAGAHLAIVFAGLAAAFLAMKVLYAVGVFEASPRIAFERDPLGKLWWFLREPLPNAISIFVLNDDKRATWGAYLTGIWAALLLLLVGLGIEWRRGGWRAGGFWLILLAVLLPTAFGVSLLAAERIPVYRTVFALTSVLLVYLALSWNNLCSLAGHMGRFIALAGYAVALTAAIAGARVHAYSLIAIPQEEELRMVEQAAERVVSRDRPARLYFVQPTPGHRPAEISYYDEFGALSTYTDWMLMEMFQQMMRERFPGASDRQRRYEIRVGFEPPPKGEKFDIVIDMRQLRKFGSLYAGSSNPNKSPTYSDPPP